ncbi:MAG: sigma factor [Opitutaceae bacterium]|nr:sigma factor [Opitutaceae bacterium]
MPTPDVHEQFMRLFLQHEPQILRMVLIYIPRQADARDVVQETAIALWQHFPDYDSARPFGSWASGFARMQVRRFLRRAHRRAYLHEQAVAVLMASDDAAGPYVPRAANDSFHLPPDSQQDKQVEPKVHYACVQKGA